MIVRNKFNQVPLEVSCLFILVYLIFHKLLTTILLFPSYGKFTLNIVICISLGVRNFHSLSLFFPLSAICPIMKWKME